MPTFSPSLFKETSRKQLREKGHRYTSFHADINEGQNTLYELHGYFQSYKYFSQDLEYILSLLHIRQKQAAFAMIYPELTLLSAVIMHFRRGDYKSKPTFHPILSVEYYANALRVLQKRAEVNITDMYFFCEDGDLADVNKIVDTLSGMFSDLIFHRSRYKGASDQDWQELLIMSLCPNIIIANSTFSWWAAMLQMTSTNDKNRCVCFPSLWFGPNNIHLETDDKFPMSWIRVEANKGKKLQPIRLPKGVNILPTKKPN